MYREEALEVHGEVCMCCGAEDNIQIHHLDGDGGNDSILNTIPLCVSCHNDTHKGETEWSRFLKDKVPPIDWQPVEHNTVHSTFTMDNPLGYSKARVDSSGKVHLGREYAGEVVGIALEELKPTS